MKRTHIEPQGRPLAPQTAPPNLTRPVWNDAQVTCKECRYNDQDIDTFPCATCHIRH